MAIGTWLLIGMVVVGVGLLIFFLYRKQQSFPRTSSFVENIFPKAKLYYNQQKGIIGRLNSQRDIIPAGGGRAHIVYRDGGALFGNRKIDEGIPRFAIQERTYGKNCQMPEGIVEVCYYDELHSPQAVQEYIREIKRLKNGVLILEKLNEQQKDLVIGGQITAVAYDRLKAHKRVTDSLLRSQSRAREEPPLVETTEKEKKIPTG